MIMMITAIEDVILKVGITLGSLSSCLLYFNILQTCSWFMLFHLCYYSISYRINSLPFFIETAIKENGNRKCIKELRTCANLFDQLCASAIEINSTFSLSVLATLTIIMILCSICLFLFIYAISEVIVLDYIKSATYVFPIIFTSNAGLILFILITVDSPTTQVSP